MKNVSEETGPVPYPGEKLEALSHQRRVRRKINGETDSTARSNIMGFSQIQFPRGSHTDGFAEENAIGWRKCRV